MREVIQTSVSYKAPWKYDMKGFAFTLSPWGHTNQKPSLGERLIQNMQFAWISSRLTGDWIKVRLRNLTWDSIKNFINTHVMADLQSWSNLLGCFDAVHMVYLNEFS